jgi:hypothetical protein
MRTIFALVCGAFFSHAQTTRAPFDKDAFAATMSFEAEHVNGHPKGWGGGPPDDRRR